MTFSTKTNRQFHYSSILMITLSAIGLAFGNVSAQAVYFADPNLKAAVEAQLGVSDPTATDMLDLTSLDASGRDITDLTGLEHGTNLTNLYLSRNQIIDISPISGLTNLTHLNLGSNQISDISPLSGLTNFTYLDLRANPLNGDAYSIYIPQILANNSGMTLQYDPPVGDFCGADFTDPDGYVDVWDLMQFADHWHTRTGEGNWDSKFDLAGPDFGDPEGYVDVWDLMVFADNWHRGQKP